MPYKLLKTNGTVLTTVQDATIDNTTNLTFVGRNYSGYGQPIEENLVYLLENFSNTTAPTRPVQGQLWFDNTDGVRSLKVCYDGTNFKMVNNVIVSSTAPTGPTLGDLWWDSDNSQLKVYTAGSTWTASSPYGGSSTSWAFDKILDNTNELRPAIEALAGYTPMLVISNTGTYYPSTSTSVSPNVFAAIKAGINLPYANHITGQSAVSTTTGHMLWGTAADALSSQRSQTAATTSTSTFYVPLVGTYTSGAQALYTTSTLSINLNTGVLNVIASSAQYADLAERYESDAVYEVGTVLVIGGEKEVTTTNQFADTRVAGIVSKNPAYMMNSEAGTDETHPFIALKGRVPCKVIGFIEKGDLLVTSAHPGYAAAAKSIAAGAVIGKALEGNSEGFNIIEVLVV